MTKLLLISIACINLFSCTLSFQNVMTSGVASDVVDSDPKTDTKLDTQLTVPVSPL